MAADDPAPDPPREILASASLSATTPASVPPDPVAVSVGQPGSIGSQVPSPKRTRRPKAGAMRRRPSLSVYVTEEDEARLRKRAADAAMSMSDYLRSAGLRTSGETRSDQSRLAQRLAVLEARLQALALEVEAAASPIVALRLTTALLVLERAVRDLVMPWQRAIAGALDDLDPQAWWSAEPGEDAIARLDETDLDRIDVDPLDLGVHGVDAAGAPALPQRSSQEPSDQDPAGSWDEGPRPEDGPC